MIRRRSVCSWCFSDRHQLIKLPNKCSATWWKFYHRLKGWWRFYRHESGAVSVVRTAMKLLCRKLSREPLKCVFPVRDSGADSRETVLQHLSKSAFIIQGGNCQQHALKIISRNINCQPSRIITSPATIIKTFSPAAEFIFPLVSLQIHPTYPAWF